MNRNRPHLANVSECTGCLACVATCRASALSWRREEDGHAYVNVDADKCIGCLKCEEICRTARSLIGNNNLALSVPYRVWAKDGALRSRSASGGVAAAAGRWFIQNGVGVAGAFFDGRRARHIFAADEGDLSVVQGSKYVWSDTSAVYREIETHLSGGKILYTGTGCQVAGVLAYFANHPLRDNLYTIDLICGGVPSDLLMQSFFKENPDVESIVSFRYKRKYELRGIVDGKEVTLEDRDLPLSGFMAEQTNRFSCYNCQYACAHRASDITIGDLWGAAAPAGDCSNGVSLVVVHSKKGRELLSWAEVSTQPLVWKDFLQDNGRLVFGRTPMSFLRRGLALNYKRMSPRDFSLAYSLSSPPFKPKGFVARVWLYLQRRIYRIRRRNYINGLLDK